MSLDEVGYHGHVPHLGDAEGLRHLLVGLLDRRGFLLVPAAGPGLEGRQLVIRGPDFDGQEVASVHFGSMRVDVVGSE